MPVSLKFNEAHLGDMVLAKVGNPIRDEPLLTSQTLCKFEEAEAELLTKCFLKRFRGLEQHRFEHHSDLASNELFSYASAIFDDPATLLEQGEAIARHLYAGSKHPNIKSGDLCVSLIKDLGVGSSGGFEAASALCIIKSESKEPFLQISEKDGDLRLTTEQGIYPEKIDKGCLIVNYDRANGFAVYLFDKGGGAQFWSRDFVGAVPVNDEESLTKHYSKLCVEFAEKGLEDTPQDERMNVASDAISYLEESEDFDLDDFKAKTMKSPERIEQFEVFKSEYEIENDRELEDRFTVSKPEANKARKRLRSRLKLDVGVDMKFASGFISVSEDFMERGDDEEKGMKYLKIWYHKEV
ncbi:MAG: hypothetical protein ACI8UO_002326 [Verrucomicrobiales bacterium]|jgi:hypothetical protein